MSSNNNWSWRRGIALSDRESWIARMQPLAEEAWMILEKPDAVRGWLSVYGRTQAQAERLKNLFGGQARKVDPKSWLKRPATPPLKIGATLEIVNRKPARMTSGRLFIPHGVAFGSGEHATTLLLLRALARLRGLERMRVLDLGTGSGILALAARRLGASDVEGVDYDAAAVRTARQNEALNFSRTTIRWKQGDAKKIKAKKRYDLVLANLFSGVLIEAAGAIARTVLPGGKLWLSGILREQAAPVTAAYKARGMRLERALRRGKWMVLLLRNQETGGRLSIVQTK